MAEGIHRNNIVRDLGCRTIGLLHPRDFVVSTTGNTSFIQRLRLHSKLPVHTGCVNSIWWSDDGEHILSGSDDTNLCITNAWSGKVVTSIRSGHRANIFSAKFMPHSGLGRVVSCSGDGILYYTDVERENTWGSNVFNCHYGTAYELLTVDNDPNTFLSCGEDGTVRWFDIRLKTTCTKDNCKDDILIKAHRAVTAIAANPHTPYHLAVGCSDSSVRLFDRRMLGTKGSGGVCGKGTLGVFCRFCPPPLTNKSCRVTSLKYSGDGQDLLVSYSSDYIYLFSPQHLTSDGHGGVKYEDSHSSSNGYSKCPEKSSKDPPVKRLRLRGDWSDTGPQSRPESERDTRAASAVADESESPQRSLMQRMTDMLQRWLEDPASFRQSMQPPQGQDSSPSSDSSTSQTTAGTPSPSQQETAGTPSTSRQEAAGTAEPSRQEAAGTAEPSQQETTATTEPSQPETVETAEPSQQETAGAAEPSQPEKAESSRQKTAGTAEPGAADSQESKEQGSQAEQTPEGTTAETAAEESAAAGPGAAAVSGAALGGVVEEKGDPAKSTETTQSDSDKNSCKLKASHITKDTSAKKDVAASAKEEEAKVKSDSETLDRSKSETKKSSKERKEQKDSGTAVLREDVAQETSPLCEIRVVDTSELTTESSTVGQTGAVAKAAGDHSNDAEKIDKLRSDSTGDKKEKTGESASLKVDSSEGQQECPSEPGAVGGSDLPDSSAVSQEDVVRPKTGSKSSQKTGGDDSRQSPPPTSETTPPTPQSDEPIHSGDSSDDDDEETSQSEERSGRPMYARLQALMKMRRQQREKEETELSQLPCPPHKMIYKGHRNARTMIKESNFFGSQYVISGSDCGHVFIWDRYTGKLVTLFEADKHVVNCVQPHPRYPVLATSGIDYDVKLWMAMAEEASFPEEAHEIMHRNEAMLEETRDTITVPASFMLRMLASLNHIRSEQDSQPAAEERRPSED
ncbi:PREDICTED: DDB1- and CUL4-associated factor 6-like [Branchiostoma belcheri]|uniref:DDB1- and CUL4-associated factor 6-like n=1 Tax=Branchiostoma belcheri TaxID=7741 RepID=A0A6P5A7J5_BRABE|nr:PREDICTED: DDB1- and CUL4-associated factor 6-like [Branchiostoma belcheri]